MTNLDWPPGSAKTICRWIFGIPLAPVFQCGAVGNLENLHLIDVPYAANVHVRPWIPRMPRVVSSVLGHAVKCCTSVNVTLAPASLLRNYGSLVCRFVALLGLHYG